MSMGVLIVLWLFGGIQPAGPQLNKMLPVIGPILNAISPFRWSFEMQVRKVFVLSVCLQNCSNPTQMILELSTYSDVWSPVVSGLYSEFSYHP